MADKTESAIQASAAELPVYTLHITIHKDMVDILNESNYKVCTGVRTEVNGKTLPVKDIAMSLPIKETVDPITWKNAFAIAASKKAHSADSEDLYDGIKEITYQSVYDLHKVVHETQEVKGDIEKWVPSANTRDRQVPTNGFAFHNHVKAAAIVYKEFNEVPAAIFKGAMWVPGTGIIVPKATSKPGVVDEVTIWFEAHDENEDVSAVDDSEKVDILFGKDVYEKAIHYNEDGQWEDVPIEHFGKPGVDTANGDKEPAQTTTKDGDEKPPATTSVKEEKPATDTNGDHSA